LRRKRAKDASITLTSACSTDKNPSARKNANTSKALTFLVAGRMSREVTPKDIVDGDVAEAERNRQKTGVQGRIRTLPTKSQQGCGKAFAKNADQLTIF
jgi:hypothetical protein